MRSIVLLTTMLALTGPAWSADAPKAKPAEKGKPADKNKAPERPKQKTQLELAFEEMDVNKDGFLTLQEYLDKFDMVAQEERKKLFPQKDRNGDGKLTFEEYKAEPVPPKK